LAGFQVTFIGRFWVTTEVKVHPETLYLWVKQGQAPKPTRLGRKLMFREVAIKEFLDDRE
jgi:predicted DNA-binding transcriptional regulator AlpA